MPLAGDILRGTVKTVGVVARGVNWVSNAVLIYQGGRWLLNLKPPPNTPRPPVLYQPESRLLFHLQSDGSYRPQDGPRAE